MQTGGGNESGCLTVRLQEVLLSSLGTNNISCNFVCQPREVVIVSSDPPLVGGTYIDVC